MTFLDLIVSNTALIYSTFLVPPAILTMLDPSFVRGKTFMVILPFCCLG
jgi:hypothetical protein